MGASKAQPSAVARMIYAFVAPAFPFRFKWLMLITQWVDSEPILIDSVKWAGCKCYVEA